MAARLRIPPTSSRDGNEICSHFFGSLLLCPRINLCPTTGLFHHTFTAPLALYPPTAEDTKLFVPLRRKVFNVTTQ